jgi:hypothetical protein
MDLIEPIVIQTERTKKQSGVVLDSTAPIAIYNFKNLVKQQAISLFSFDYTFIFVLRHVPGSISSLMIVKESGTLPKIG